MKPRKPCKRCKHKKGGHAWNPNYVAGGEYFSNVNYPCQEKGCDCNYYREMTNEELMKYEYL